VSSPGSGGGGGGAPEEGRESSLNEIRAAGYIRVSTDEQALEGLSLDDQDERITQYIASRGWEFAGIFKDGGVSGSIPFGQRPDGARALEQAPELDRLVVIRFDRFGRNAVDMLTVAGELRAHGCIVVSITEASIEDASSQGDLVRGISAVVAQHQRAQIAERGREAAAAMARQGRYNGPRPCGYRFDDDARLVIVEHEVPIVRRIVAEFLAGSSRRQITRELIADNVPTVRGGRWREATVSSVLANPVYVGRVRYRGREYPGQHEPILDEDTWQKVQALLEAARGSKSGWRGRPPKGKHLFVHGMLRCGACGEAMVARTNHGYEDYLCNGRMSYGTDFCSQGTVKRRVVDSAVYAYFEQVGLDVEATRRQLAEARDRKLAELNGLLKAAEQQAQQAHERLARVRRDYVDGKLDAEDWQTFRAELGEEQAAAAAEAKRLRSQQAEVDAWAEVSDAERATLEQLAKIRAALAGEVQAADGIEAVRVALLRLFEGFVLHRADSSAAPRRAHAELDFADDYMIEPVIREQSIEGYSENLTPVLHREPLQQAENKNSQGVGYRLIEP